MSGLRNGRNVDYDEDLSDAEPADYYDGEDEVAMARGVLGVREALGDNQSKVTTEQIQDSLWNNYYNVEESVKHLTTTYIDAEAMNRATLEVLSELGEAAKKVTTKQVQEALWHYYYDVDKTLLYLVKTYVDPLPQTPHKKHPNAGKKSVSTTPKSHKASRTGTSTPATVASAAAEVQGLALKETARPKSKKLDVVKEYEQSKRDKKSASFVVVGHVDAGKSTLMGRLLLDLKFVDSATVERYRRQAEKIGKQSFALAWVMDQRAEERNRGVTMDIATNHFETDKTKFTILDAPGHKDFIPNMIAGASQADFAILVVDANTGAFERGLKGQTREHVLLLRSLGVHRIIVAVNKLDMVGWSKGRYDDISQQATGFLTKTGFLEKNLSFIPISGLNGDNLARRLEDERASWYLGMTLTEALDATQPLPRSLTRPFRMAISEHWRSALGKTTVSGRIDTGCIQVGDALLVQPAGDMAYIKSIMADTDVRDWAVAGENVSLALTSVDPSHLRVGDIMCHEASPIGCSDTFTMKAMAFEHLMPMPIDLHRGRLHAAGQILEIEALLDKATGAIIRKRPQVIQPGRVAKIKVRLGSRIPLEAGQRVVIRSGGETVAAGLIE